MSMVVGLELEKVKQLVGLKNVTISNFANKILHMKTLRLTLHYLITSLFIIQMSFLFSDFIR